MIKPLNWEQFYEIYNTSMQEAFPPEEIKPLELLKERYEKKSCVAYAFYDERNQQGNNNVPYDKCCRQRKAYAVFQKPDKGNIWLLDYLAVEQEFRGTGVGSRFLKEMKEVITEPDAIMGEIELISNAENEEQRVIRVRRKKFYMDNGLVETGITTKADGGILYEIICMPVKKAVYEEDARAAMKAIYGSLFEKTMYEIYGDSR